MQQRQNFIVREYTNFISSATASLALAYLVMLNKQSFELCKRKKNIRAIRGRTLTAADILKEA